jgi:hypothetical protein
MLNRSLNMLLALFCLASPLLSRAESAFDQKFNRLLSQAQARKLTYLPDYILDRKRVCPQFLEPEKTQCLRDLENHAEQVFSCPQSIKRFQEGIEYDEWLSGETFLKNNPAAVPSAIERIFERMVSAVHSLSGRPFHFDWRLQSYQSPGKNAHALVGGKIFLSAGLWAGESPLTTGEIAAILAHEVTHVVAHHGMHLNCLAVEWLGSHYNVHEAQINFLEDFRGSRRFEVWSRMSQDFEYQADAGAVKLLRSIGMDPGLMAQALEKIRPKSEGFTSGSHPDFDLRIEAARKAARN